MNSNISRELTELEMQGLARAVARGPSAASWARRHDAELAVVQETCLQPEFQTLVQAHRLRVADRMVGRLITLSAPSVEQMFSASMMSSSYHVKLSACRILMDKWLEVARRFDDCQQLAELKAELLELQQDEQQQLPGFPR